LIVGNLNEDGYLIASDDELMGVTSPAAPEADAVAQENVLKEAEALGLDAALVEDESGAPDFSADWANPAVCPQRSVESRRRLRWHRLRRRWKPRRFRLHSPSLHPPRTRCISRT